MIWVPPLWHCGGGLLLILFPSPPPLGIAKKEIMQMREAAVAESRAPVVAPLNAGPFAVSCNVRIPKGFPATCVRSLSLHAKGISAIGLPGGRASEREALDCEDATRVPELCGRCETNIYYPRESPFSLCGPGPSEHFSNT